MRRQTFPRPFSCWHQLIRLPTGGSTSGCLRSHGRSAGPDASSPAACVDSSMMSMTRHRSAAWRARRRQRRERHLKHQDQLLVSPPSPRFWQRGIKIVVGVTGNTRDPHGTVRALPTPKSSLRGIVRPTDAFTPIIYREGSRESGPRRPVVCHWAISPASLSAAVRPRRSTFRRCRR